MTLKKIAILVPLISVLNSIFQLLEWETSCFELRYDMGMTTENFLGVCEDGEKRGLHYSDLRFTSDVHISSDFNFDLRYIEGYEVFRGLKMLIVHQVVPFILTVFFLYKNYRYYVESSK